MLGVLQNSCTALHKYKVPSNYEICGCFFSCLSANCSVGNLRHRQTCLKYYLSALSRTNAEVCKDFQFHREKKIIQITQLYRSHRMNLVSTLYIERIKNPFVQLKSCCNVYNFSDFVVRQLTFYIVLNRKLCAMEHHGDVIESGRGEKELHERTFRNTMV